MSQAGAQVGAQTGAQTGATGAHVVHAGAQVLDEAFPCGSVDFFYLTSSAASVMDPETNLVSGKFAA